VGWRANGPEKISWAAAEKEKKEELGRGERKTGRIGKGFGVWVFFFSNPFQTNFQTFLNQIFYTLFTIFFINYFKNF
jgi:hypothetical protein